MIDVTYVGIKYFKINHNMRSILYFIDQCYTKVMYVELFSKLVIHENCDPKNLATQTSDLQMRILLNNREKKMCIKVERTHVLIFLLDILTNQQSDFCILKCKKEKQNHNSVLHYFCLIHPF